MPFKALTVRVRVGSIKCGTSSAQRNDIYEGTLDGLWRHPLFGADQSRRGGWLGACSYEPQWGLSVRHDVGQGLFDVPIASFQLRLMPKEECLNVAQFPLTT